MKLLCSFLTLFLSYVTIFGQDLNGKIVDATSQEPIPFANVQLGKNYGVISNDEGFFNIQPKGITANSFLLFSSLGHEDLQILVSEFIPGQIVTLKQANFELDEVVLSNVKLSANKIIDNFLANKKENHRTVNANIQLFTRRNSDYQAKEFNIDVKKASFLKKSERKNINDRMEDLGKEVSSTISNNYREQLSEVYMFEDTVMTQHFKALELINRDKNTDTDEIQSKVFFELLSSLESNNSFKVKTGVFTIEKEMELNELIEDIEVKKSNVPDTLKHKNNYTALNFLYASRNFDHEFLEKEKRYDYSLEGMTYAHGHTCYHISFEPSGGKGKYQGNMYINVKDFGMVAYDYNLVDGKKAFSVNLKLLVGVKANSFKNSGYFIYAKGEGGYYAKYIREKKGDYVYLNRNFSFKENNASRRERKNLKFNFELEYVENSTTEYVAIQYQTIDPKIKGDLSFIDYILIDEKAKYDPSYWKGFNVIEATEAIRNYD